MRFVLWVAALLVTAANVAQWYAFFWEYRLISSSPGGAMLFGVGCFLGVPAAIYAIVAACRSVVARPLVTSAAWCCAAVTFESIEAALVPAWEMAPMARLLEVCGTAIHGFAVPGLLIIAAVGWLTEPSTAQAN